MKITHPEHSRHLFGVLQRQSPLQELGDGGGAGGHLKFFVDAMEVGADGEGADMKPGSDFGVAQAATQVFEDFQFARAQGVHFALGLAARLEGFDDQPSDGGGHGRTAGMNF